MRCAAQRAPAAAAAAACRPHQPCRHVCPAPRPSAPQSYLMLTRWLPDSENKLPPNASHQVGVGAVVINARREVLVVQERHGPLRGKDVWKMPTGLVRGWRGPGRGACLALQGAAAPPGAPRPSLARPRAERAPASRSPCPPACSALALSHPPPPCAVNMPLRCRRCSRARTSRRLRSGRCSKRQACGHGLMACWPCGRPTGLRLARATCFLWWCVCCAGREGNYTSVHGPASQRGTGAAERAHAQVV